MKIKIFNIRLTKEYMEIDQEKVNAFLDTIDLKKSSTTLVKDKINYWSVILHYQEKKRNQNESIQKTYSELTPNEKKVYEALREWRKSIADVKKQPTFTILHNQTLVNIVSSHVENIEQLSSISGIGDVKLRQYGEDIIAVLNAF